MSIKTTLPPSIFCPLIGILRHLPPPLPNIPGAKYHTRLQGKTYRGHVIDKSMDKRKRMHNTSSLKFIWIDWCPLQHQFREPLNAKTSGVHPRKRDIHSRVKGKIGSGLCVIDSKSPNTLEQKGKKTQTPSPIEKRGRASTRRIFISPTDTSTLCRGLTECPNGEKCTITLPVRPKNKHKTTPDHFFQTKHTSYYQDPYSSTPSPYSLIKPFPKTS